MVVISRGHAPEVSILDIMREERQTRERRREEERTARETEQQVRTKSNRDYAVLIPEPKVGTLNLEDYPFEEELLSDEVAMLPDVVVMKSTQVGVTTITWRWLLRRVDLFGETGIYYFPTDDHVTKFADERVRPALDDGVYLRSRAVGVQNKHQRQFGRGNMYFLGLSINTTQSIPADCLVIDEYDEADPVNVGHAERRLTGAAAAGRTARVRRIGRPTLPGYGIAAEFDRSDKRVWMVDCPECEHTQPVKFSSLRWRTAKGGDEVMRAGHDVFEQRDDVEEVWRACTECECSLEPTSREDHSSPIHRGRWVPTAAGPGRIRGYHVTRFIQPFADLKQVVAASRGTKAYDLELFTNADLGEPFVATEAALTEEAIKRAMALGQPAVGEYRGRFPVTAGIDVASERALNVRVSEIGHDGKRRALWIGLVEDDPGAGKQRGARYAFEKLDDVMSDYRVHAAVIDSMPERRSARAFANRHPGRVFLSEYDDDWKAEPFRVDPRDPTKVKVNRVEGLDSMMDSIRELRNLPNSLAPENYVEHLMAPKRRTEEDSKGRPRRVYVTTGTKGDDYAHAEVYDLVAGELLFALAYAEEHAGGAGEVIETEGYETSDPRNPYGYDPGFGGGGY